MQKKIEFLPIFLIECDTIYSAHVFFIDFRVERMASPTVQLYVKPTCVPVYTQTYTRTSNSNIKQNGFRFHVGRRQNENRLILSPNKNRTKSKCVETKWRMRVRYKMICSYSAARVTDNSELADSDYVRPKDRQAFTSMIEIKFVGTENCFGCVTLITQKHEQKRQPDTLLYVLIYLVLAVRYWLNWENDNCTIFSRVRVWVCFFLYCWCEKINKWTQLWL